MGNDPQLADILPDTKNLCARCGWHIYWHHFLSRRGLPPAHLAPREKGESMFSKDAASHICDRFIRKGSLLEAVWEKFNEHQA